LTQILKAFIYIVALGLSSRVTSNLFTYSTSGRCTPCGELCSNVYFVGQRIQMLIQY